MDKVKKTLLDYSLHTRQCSLGPGTYIQFIAQEILL